jgi:frataxin-like iron-binding protein CyaY
MTKLKNILALLTISYMGIIQAQYTAIPDPIFEEFLISEGMDDVIDGQVLTANINDRTHLVINEPPPIFLLKI